MQSHYVKSSFLFRYSMLLCECDDHRMTQETHWITYVKLIFHICVINIMSCSFRRVSSSLYAQRDTTQLMFTELNYTNLMIEWLNVFLYVARFTWEYIIDEDKEMSTFKNFRRHVDEYNMWGIGSNQSVRQSRGLSKFDHKWSSSSYILHTLQK